MKKKILALILAVEMCVTALFVAALAANIEKIPSTIPGTDIAYNRVENVTVKIPGTDVTFELEGVSDMVGLTYEEGIPVYRFAFYESGKVVYNVSGVYAYESIWVYKGVDTSDYFWGGMGDAGPCDEGFTRRMGPGEYDLSNPSFNRYFTYILEDNNCAYYLNDERVIAKVEFIDGNGGSYKDLWFPYDLMSYEKIDGKFLPAEIEKFDISEIAVTDGEENTENEGITENPQYSVTKGADSVWDSSSSDDLTITADGDFSKFTGIKIDNELLDTANYDAKSGSTVVTLKASYLRTLSSGKHTVTFVYTDGEVSTQFEIKGAKTSSNSQSVEIPNTDNDLGNTESVTALVLTIAVITLIFGAAVIKNKKYLVK